MCYAEIVVLNIYLNRRIRLLRDAPNWVCSLVCHAWVGLQP